MAKKSAPKKTAARRPTKATARKPGMKGMKNC